MNMNIKRLLKFVIAAMLILSLIPAVALAEDAAEYAINDLPQTGYADAKPPVSIIMLAVMLVMCILFELAYLTHIGNKLKAENFKETLREKLKELNIDSDTPMEEF